MALPCKGVLKSKPVPVKPVPTNTPVKYHDVITAVPTAFNKKHQPSFIARANKILGKVARQNYGHIFKLQNIISS